MTLFIFSLHRYSDSNISIHEAEIYDGKESLYFTLKTQKH